VKCQINKKNAIIAASAVGGALILGGCAVLIYNSKKMKAMRAVKRASRVMYHVGTAMRNISGEAGTI